MSGRMPQKREKKYVQSLLNDNPSQQVMFNIIKRKFITYLWSLTFLKLVKNTYMLFTLVSIIY